MNNEYLYLEIPLISNYEDYLSPEQIEELERSEKEKDKEDSRVIIIEI